MGLDIYFHKVKKVRKSKGEPFTMTLEEVNKLNDKRAKDRVRIFGKRVVNALERMDADAYKEFYENGFLAKLPKYTRYSFTYENMEDGVKDVNEVRDFFKRFVSWTYAESDAYFRKVNFVYQFFSDKLEDECCFVTKSDLEDMIDRCDKVLKNHKLAKKLLPTRSGFFFGSTDYNEWYFKDVEDVREQFKKLLDGFNEDTDVIYVIMSW